MAKKINFSDTIKNEEVNSDLSAVLSYKDSTSSKKTVQFSYMKLADIKLDPQEQFTNLLPIEDENLEHICENMKKYGFRKEQALIIVHIENENGCEEGFLGDGHTRKLAAEMAEIDEVPVTHYYFANRKEAEISMIELQLNRRNMDDALKFKTITRYMELRGQGKAPAGTGKTSEKIAKLTGTSTRQVEKINSIKNSANQELIDAIENKEISINQAYNKLHNQKKNEKADRQLSVQDETFDDIDDISDSLSDNEGTPAGLNFNHSDGIERPSNKTSAEEDSERTRERRNAYEKGCEDGFHKALVFALAEVSNGKTVHQIWNDERVRNIKYSEFKLPDGYEEMISDWWYDDDSEEWKEETNDDGFMPDIEFNEETK